MQALVRQEEIGNSIMFVGEIVEIASLTRED